MKIIIRVILSIALIFLGFKLLIPFKDYPMAHFEQWLIQIIPVSWKAISIIARIFDGFLFFIAFLLLFYWEKTKWTKYVSILMIAIPFIVNSVFPSHFKTQNVLLNEALFFKPTKNTQEKTLFIYVSDNCFHCKEALKRISIAKEISNTFPAVHVISYNYKIQKFLEENQINFSLDSIDANIFIDATQGTFPKYELVQNNKTINKWYPSEFNYAVLDNLSKQK